MAHLIAKTNGRPATAAITALIVAESGGFALLTYSPPHPRLPRGWEKVESGAADLPDAAHDRKLSSEAIRLALLNKADP